jgi:ABC-2 type transport system permease protein
VRALRSEAIRVMRPSLRALGLGLAAVFGVLTTVVVMTTAKGEPGAGADGFATIVQITAPGGFFASFGLLSRFIGLAALSVCALSVDTDYRSGFIRLLVQAQPKRSVLFASKAITLAAFAAMMSAVGAAVTLFTAFPMAKPANIDRALWTDGLARYVSGGYFNLTVAAFAWGSIGLLISLATKNAGVAIGTGVGWLLLLEPILGMASKPLADYLPGGTISAVASGGTANLAWVVALTLTLTYTAAATTASWLLVRRRDITD